MSFYFLLNTAGSSATSYTLGSGTTATGYNLYDSISGTRAKTHRTIKSSSEVLRQYSYASDLNIDYCVITRADLALTKNGTRVRLKQKSSGGSWSYISGVDYNPLASSDLIGIKSQDLVVSCSPSDLRGIALSTLPASGSEASEISKFYGCASYSSLGAPQKSYVWQNTEPRTYGKTIKSGLRYEITRTFTLVFEQLSQSTVSAFYEKEEIFNFPFFIYDPSNYLWAWELEHVIILGLEEIFINKDLYNLSITFGRLAHNV